MSARALVFIIVLQLDSPDMLLSNSKTIFAPRCVNQLCSLIVTYSKFIDVFEWLYKVGGEGGGVRGVVPW